MFIESSQNKIIKEIGSLKQKKYREKTGLFIAEGERLLSEANPIYVLAGENYGGDLSKFDKVYTTDEKLFNRLAATVNPQGIIGVCKIPRYNINDILQKPSPFVVLLDRVADPGNMGTIIRTADAAGVDAVLLSKGCVDPYNLKTIRSTMGSIFHIPVCTDVDLVEFIKDAGIKTFAAHLKGEKSCFDIEMTADNGCGILIGNEANGLSDEIAQQADELVKIPMPGKAESMNASVAAAIMIYEAVRQRLKG